MVVELFDLVDSTLKIIDSNIENLNGLRAECDVTERFTQADIRKLEEKLLRQFSQILVWRKQLQKEHPDERINTGSWLQRWIQVTELSSSSRKIIEDEYPGDFDEFFNTSEESFLEILQESDEAHRFAKALKCLKLCMKEIENGNNSSRIIQIHWDSIDDLQTTQLTNGQSTGTISEKNATDGCDENSLNHISNSHDQTKANSNNTTIPGTVATTATTPTTAATISQSSVYVPTEYDDQMSTSYTGSEADPLTPNKRSSSHTLDLMDGSMSFVSSPISPMSRPPLSAGYKSNLSDISSSPSIIPYNFYNQSITSNSSATFNFDVDSIERSKKGTPPITPPSKKSFGILSTPKTERKKPATPPPTRRFQAGNIFLNEQFPLTKSKSHEEQLSNRIEPLDPAIHDKFLKKYNLGLYAKNEAHNNANDDKKGSHHHQQDHNSLDNLPQLPKMSLIHRRRLATEPGSIGSTSPILLSSNSSSPTAFSPIDPKYDNLDLKIDSSDIFLDPNVPRSPRSSGMRHSIHHRFTTMIKLSSNVCNVCGTPMYFGYKCRDCKYICHSNCASKAPNSCGLPNEFFDVFKQTLSEIDVVHSPTLARSTKSSLSSASFSHSLRTNKTQQLSLSSSNPSSPSLIQDRHNSFSSLTTLNPSPSSTKDGLQFQFPVPNENTDKSQDSSESSTSSGKLRHLSMNGTIETIHEEEVFQSLTNSLVTSISSSESTRNITVRLDSQNSQDADKLDESGNKKANPREWDIPYEELLFEEEIGIGRFGKVFKGNWHGPVAIKQLHLGDTMLESDEKAFESFKEEVGIFRKTRHVNLVLFMGACMKPPHLAIVSSYCKGVSLHTHIHVRKDKFNMSRITSICEQICLGMGYLHSKAIVHKDLKPKNIFYENGKVVITDFGLSSVAKLRHPIRKTDRLSLPKGWLCYLAPEIMRALNVENCEIEDLPFTFSTDIYAFGTVFYELLVGDWPFVGQPSEVIIWQVGKGMRPPLFNLQASKEVKDILFQCWSFQPESRPDFGRELSELFLKLPKKRLQRSPSHPAHLQHTSEQNF